MLPARIDARRLSSVRCICRDYHGSPLGRNGGSMGCGCVMWLCCLGRGNEGRKGGGGCTWRDGVRGIGIV